MFIEIINEMCVDCSIVDYSIIDEILSFMVVILIIGFFAGIIMIGLLAWICLWRGLVKEVFTERKDIE